MEKFIVLVFIACVLLLIVSLIYLYAKSWRDKHESWKEKAKIEEKELHQSLKIVQSIDRFNHWIFKYSDEEFIAKYKNDSDGSVSSVRLASLKLYDQFIDLDERFFHISKGIYNLPSSFFSKVSMEAKETIDKIENSKKLMMEALRRKHISPNEAILTVRSKMKEFYELLRLPLSEIAILDRFAIENERKESIELLKNLKQKYNDLKLQPVKLDHVKTKDVKNAKKIELRKINSQIKKQQEKIKISAQDFKLRNYLSKHGEIQKVAKEYLKYIEEIRKPIQ